MRRGEAYFVNSVIALKRVGIIVAYPSFPGDLKHFKKMISVAKEQVRAEVTQ